MLYRAGIGVGLNATEIDRHRDRVHPAGQARQHSGACNTWLVGKSHLGVWSRTGGPQTTWKLLGPIRLRSRVVSQWHLDSAYVIQGLVGYEGSQEDV